MSAALVQPVWLPPRTTLGAPNTMASPASAASRAVSSLTGNSAMPTPWARKVLRMAGLGSACLGALSPSQSRGFVFVREHFDVGGSRRFRQSRDRCGDVMTAGNDALHQ